MKVERDVWGIAFAMGASLFALLLVTQETAVLPVPVYLPYLSLALPLLAIPALMRPRREGDGDDPSSALVAPMWLAPLAVSAAFGVALAVRLGPSLQHPVLLGYDPGLYKYVFDAYIAALPGVPEADLPQWVRHVYPQGLPMLTTLLHVAGGIGPEQFMRYVFPVMSAALVFPLYLVARDAFGPRAAIITALIFAVSYTQLFTFGLMYLKNVVALFLLLLALHALHHRQRVVFGLLLGGVGVYHRPTFLVAGLIVLAYLLVTRRRDVLPAVGLAVLIVVPPMLLRMEENWGLLQRTLATSAEGIAGGVGAGGTFFDVSDYRWASLGYAPFALVAAMYLVARRQWAIPLLWLVGCAGLVAFQLFFFRRHLIPLDVGMLLLAGKGLELTLLHARQWGGAVTAGALVLVLLAGVAMPSWRYTQEAHALVAVEQIEAIEWLARETPVEARVLASAYDAPWVVGWSRRDVIAPGQFEWDRHTRDQWMIFLEGVDSREAAEFLVPYESPLYIYHSGALSSHMDTGKFQEPFFSLVYEQGPARVWGVIPGAVAWEEGE